jgi:hypothetical protein
MARVVEPDGSVVIRSQAIDQADEVRKDMDENYKQAIKDSVTKRQPGGGSKMPGMGDPRGSGGKRRRGR